MESRTTTVSVSSDKSVGQKYNYEESIDTLNKLPSNAVSISESINSGHSYKISKRDSILRYLEYVGVKSEALNRLSVIHVAGTKGKGTTSALCESILRAHGYKTGFYSSPHLVSVTERIRLNGTPISQNYFAQVFNNIYNELAEKCENDLDRPPYFGFLTVMALKVFIDEKVDVAILEVGIGGEYDQTNILKNVSIVGITSLGLDHVPLLGNTIGEIAEQKAGIMKPGCKAFTVQQPKSAMKVLHKMSIKRKCTLTVVPKFEEYNWSDLIDKEVIEQGYPTRQLNTSLAIQLTHSWMNLYSNKVKSKNNYNCISKPNCDNMIKNIPKKTSIALRTCIWPGRCQILKRDFEHIYIDGAHTVESMEVCANWFKKQCRPTKKALIFYVTKGRDPKPLMDCLIDIGFDVAFFVPDKAFDEVDSKNPIDQINMSESRMQTINKCVEYSTIWREMVLKHNVKTMSTHSADVNVYSDVYTAIKYTPKSVGDATQVLITGSLYLAGAALTALNENMNILNNAYSE